MAYDDLQNDRDQIPPPPPVRRSVDEETLVAENDRRARPPEQPAGWGCSKGCLYGMAGCGCLTVILMAVGGFALFNLFKGAFSTDPVVVLATAREIADFDVPPDLKPIVKVEILFIKTVEFQSADGQSRLSLAQIDPSKIPGGNVQNVNFDQGAQGNRRHLVIAKSEQRDLKVRGEEVKVTFAEGKDAETGNEFRSVKARFQGKSGPAEFELQVPKEKYKEEDVLKFIDGIK